MSPSSPLPDLYYAVFAFYEPFLCMLSFVGVLVDPKGTHDAQAPWPAGGPPSGLLPPATFMTITQLGHVCALLGVVNHFILTTARRHLGAHPALQERMVSALLTPLLFGDIFHLVLTFWALGDDKWDVRTWEASLWSVVIIGISLLIPRICWHMGIGRYVDKRDGHLQGHRYPSEKA